MDDLRVRNNWKYMKMADLMNAAAHKAGEPNTNFGRHTIRNAIAGRVPHSDTLGWMADAWNVPIPELSAIVETHRDWRAVERAKTPPAYPDSAAAVQQAHSSPAPAGSLVLPAMLNSSGEHGSQAVELGAADASGLAAWIQSTNTSDEAIEYLAIVTAATARDHTQQAPASVLDKALYVHHQVRTLLQGGRQRLRQTRELFRIDAQLLAHICLLLGDLRRDDAANAYGSAAILAANEAGSSPAEAYSAQAQMARWRNRYADAADLAAAGYAVSPPTSLRVLLACQEANAAALAGDSTRARQALARAEAAQTDDTTDSAWTCPPGRQALYRLAVALHTGDPSEALHQAAIARASWVPGQPMPFGTSAHTRIAASIAHLKLGAVEAASEHLRPVLELPSQYRLATLTEHMATMHALLTPARYRDSPEAEQLRDRIAEFIDGARTALDVEEG